LAVWGQRFAAVGEPVEQYVRGQVVERAAVAGDGDPAAGEVDIVEVQGADLSRPGGVDGDDQVGVGGPDGWTVADEGVDPVSPSLASCGRAFG
jgi:hypothetical protein